MKLHDKSRVLIDIVRGNAQYCDPESLAEQKKFVESDHVEISTLRRSLEAYYLTGKNDVISITNLRKYYRKGAERSLSNEHGCDFCSSGGCFVFRDRVTHWFAKTPTRHPLSESCFPCKCGKARSQWDIAKPKQTKDWSTVLYMHENNFVFNRQGSLAFSQACFMLRPAFAAAVKSRKFDDGIDAVINDIRRKYEERN